MTLVDRLKELRKENNMTQSELANMLGMAKGTVAMWEMGKRNPSFESLEKMSEIFDRRVDYILGKSDDSSSPKLSDSQIQELGRWQAEEDLAEIVMKYLRLDERGKASVEALINTEFNFCRQENILLPREDYLLSIRTKKE
ncbi:MAG: helix-turn-helix transcriptional regulator [Epulopiscium sp.]|nr:helix-turn-helix transcriptional regulator [Candidatus Epulonipiscium sp.]